MEDKPKILAFAGSLRKNSFNKKMVDTAVKGAEEAGAVVTLIDLKDYPLPIYDQDIEDATGLPENALKLKKLFMENDGLLIAAPEYNSSISGVLKNVIDWVSRPAIGESVYLCCFINKVVVLMSASPGNLGGMRGLVHVRSIFGNINSIVLPAQKCIPNADKVFDASGKIIDPKIQKEVLDLGKDLTHFISKLKSGAKIASHVG
jgi:NAD(P)H-dependent FMN reductase